MDATEDRAEAALQKKSKGKCGCGFRVLPQGLTRPYTEWAEVNTIKGEYIGDWYGIPEIFIFHLNNNLLSY